MSDQADALRLLFRDRPAAAGPPIVRARSLVFTSGKGGVGTSNLALNVAIALGEYGQRVVLVDADLGLANLDLLCGLSPRRDLGDVLAGHCSLAESLIAGPGEITIVPGAHGMRTLPEALVDGPSRLAAELAELEAGADFLVVDAGSGLGPSVPSLASAADQLVVVATPEPTAMADAHAAIGRFRRGASPTIRALVNQATNRAEGADCLARLVAGSRQFHGLVVSPLGIIRADPKVPLAVRCRRPFLTEYPSSTASKGVRLLARSLIAERSPRARRPGFFRSLAARLAPGRASM